MKRRSLILFLALLSLTALSSYAQQVAGSAQAPANNHTSTDTSDPQHPLPLGVSDPTPDLYSPPTPAPTRHAAIHGTAVFTTPTPESTFIPHTIHTPVPAGSAIPSGNFHTSGSAEANPNLHGSTDTSDPTQTPLHPHDPDPATYDTPTPPPTRHVAIAQIDGGANLASPAPGSSPVPHFMTSPHAAPAFTALSPTPGQQLAPGTNAIETQAPHLPVKSPYVPIDPAQTPPPFGHVAPAPSVAARQGPNSPIVATTPYYPVDPAITPGGSHVHPAPSTAAKQALSPAPYYPVDPAINHAGHLHPAPSAVSKQAFSPIPYYPVDPAITPAHNHVHPAPSAAAKPPPDSTLSTSGIHTGPPRKIQRPPAITERQSTQHNNIGIIEPTPYPEFGVPPKKSATNANRAGAANSGPQTFPTIAPGMHHPGMLHKTASSPASALRTSGQSDSRSRKNGSGDTTTHSSGRNAVRRDGQNSGRTMNDKEAPKKGSTPAGDRPY